TVSCVPWTDEHCSLHFFFSSRRRHTRSKHDWSSDVCSSDLIFQLVQSIKRGDKVIAIVAPAFINQFPGMTPSKLKAAMRKLGFEIGRASCRERAQRSVGGGGEKRKARGSRGGRTRGKRQGKE